MYPTMDDGMPTFHSTVTHWAAQTPDRLCFRFEDAEFSYREFDEETNRYAHGFARLGVQAGDRVAFQLDNGVTAALTVFALSKLGAIVVPINTAYNGRFLAHPIADAGAKIVVIQPRFAAGLAQVKKSIPGVERVVSTGDAVDGFESHRFDELRTDFVAQPQLRIDPSEPAFIMYTSGTTGPAKGCLLSHRYVRNTGRQSIWCHSLTSSDTYWIPTPMFHMGSLIMCIGAVLSVGGTAAIPEKFSVRSFWSDIEQSKATVTVLVGIMNNYIIDAGATPESERVRGQLRLINGAPLSAEMAQIYRTRFGVGAAQPAGYGMTEANPMVTNRISEMAAPPGSSGRASSYFDIKVVDQDGHECSPGIAGEILARPRYEQVMMDGYWRNPEATEHVMREGWFHTGDIGRIDKDGWFYFVDRAKDYIRRGGENISSMEMEEVFLSHPAIEEAAICGVPGASEDEVKLTAVLREGCLVSPEEICHWSTDQVPRFAVPRYVEIRDSLPRNEVGRVLKYRLKEEGVTPSTWDRQGSSATARS